MSVRFEENKVAVHKDVHFGHSYKQLKYFLQWKIKEYEYSLPVGQKLGLIR